MQKFLSLPEKKDNFRWSILEMTNQNPDLFSGLISIVAQVKIFVKSLGGFWGNLEGLGRFWQEFGVFG